LSPSSEQSYRRGAFYAVLAGVLLSATGLIVRYIDQADAWTVLFYRSIAFSITVLVFIQTRGDGGLRKRIALFRLRDALVSIALACGFIFYILSLYRTSVANTVLLLSTGPFVAALLGWALLRERVSKPTWFTMLLAVIGVVVMVVGGVSYDDQAGMLYAFGAVSAFSVMVVLLRLFGPQRDMLLPIALAGVVTAIMCLPFLSGFAITPTDLALSLCLGIVQIGFGFILITLASRSVPAAQVPLLALSETALSPVWVWLFINEIPTSNTIVGGVIVLLAVLLQGIAGVREQARL